MVFTSQILVFHGRPTFPILCIIDVFLFVQHICIYAFYIYIYICICICIIICIFICVSVPFSVSVSVSSGDPGGTQGQPEGNQDHPGPSSKHPEPPRSHQGPPRRYPGTPRKQPGPPRTHPGATQDPGSTKGQRGGMEGACRSVSPQPGDKTGGGQNWRQNPGAPGGHPPTPI